MKRYSEGLLDAASCYDTPQFRGGQIEHAVHFNTLWEVLLLKKSTGGGSQKSSSSSSGSSPGGRDSDAKVNDTDTYWDHHRKYYPVSLTHSSETCRTCKQPWLYG